ncbi:hypothetical protein V6615_02890 [Oscillospiraceae bacterium PP1C4]
MDKLILGLLILKSCTIYELRSIIHDNLQEICSDSMGAIYAAVKKLLSLDMISFVTYVENGKNKKEYSITEEGFAYFNEWVNQPISLGKSRNPEVAKLYFMGLSKKENRIALISQYKNELESSLQYMLAVRKTATSKEATAYTKEKLSNGLSRLSIPQQLTNTENLSQTIDDIRFFSLLSLDYGIYCLENEIKWYEKLKEKLQEMYQ